MTWVMGCTQTNDHVPLKSRIQVPCSLPLQFYPISYSNMAFTSKPISNPCTKLLILTCGLQKRCLSHRFYANAEVRISLDGASLKYSTNRKRKVVKSNYNTKKVKENSMKVLTVDGEYKQTSMEEAHTLSIAVWKVGTVEY